VPGERIQFDMVVGLGNPGPDYAHTRHNAGFWFVDEIAREFGASLNLDKKSFASVGKARIGERTVHLVKPANYMNNSGQGVAAVARFFKIGAPKMLVAHDELDLPAGHIRLKRGGGHGGHNGLRDITQKLGSGDFWRLRIGIGHPGHKSAVSGYVLRRAPADQQILIDEGIALAMQQAGEIIDGDIMAATQVLHRHKP